MRPLKKISVNERVLFFIFLLLYFGTAVFLVVKYNTTVLLEFTRFAHDNSAHLYIPAAVVENGGTSKFANFGTVWPFLYHVASTPFVVSDFMYRTGLAGAVLNSFLVAGSAVLIFRIIGGSEGFFVSLLFGLNIYSLIHASSSYMIPLGQFLALFATVYVLQYSTTGSGKPLTKAVLLLMLSTVSRYEAWPMAFVMASLVIYREIQSGRKWRIYSHLPLMFMGIEGWILYNWAIFGNPFEFITHPSPGAAGYYFLVMKKIIMPWTVDFTSIGRILLRMMGPAVIFLPFGVLGYLKEKNGHQFLIFVLSSCILLLAESPHLLIRDHALYYYFSLPFLFIISGKGIGSIIHIIGSRKVRVVFILLLLVSYGLYEFSGFSRFLGELRHGNRVYIHEKAISDEIVKHWNGGYIMYSSILGSYYFSVIEGIKPKYIIDEYDNPLCRKFSLSPWRHNVSVLVIPDPESYRHLKRYFLSLWGEECYAVLYYENESWRNEFLNYYFLLYNSSVELYGARVMIYTRRNHTSSQPTEHTFKLTQHAKVQKLILNRHQNSRI